MTGHSNVAGCAAASEVAPARNRDKRLRAKAWRNGRGLRDDGYFKCAGLHGRGVAPVRK